MTTTTADPPTPVGVNGHWSSLTRLLEFAWPRLGPEQRWRIGGASILLMSARVASLAIPWILGRLVGVAAERTGELFAIMAGLVAAYTLMRFIQVLCTELKDVLFVNVVQRSIRALARDLFANLHHLPLEFHLGRQTGGLYLAIERGTKAIEFMFVSVIFRFIPTFIELIAVCFIFWGLYGYLYAVVTAITIIIYAIFTTLVSHWRIKFRRRLNDANENTSTRAVDSLINHETVKIFNAEEREVERFDDALAVYERAAIVTQLTLSLLNVGQAIIITIGLAAILLLAATDASAGTIDAGDLATLNAYLLQMFLPLGFLGTIYRMVSQAMIDMEKAFQLLDTPSTLPDRPDARPLPAGPGIVEFRGVGINLGGREILKDISFTIPAKARYALVGKTGAGKTTITRLLARLLDTDQGQVFIDGLDVRDVTQLSVREAIAFVPQDVVMFNNTLRMNTIFGNPNASDNDIKAALHTAGLEEFIARLPDGLETQVGERGLKLSGGERQRLAIARALLKNPRIMVLDEATSALDTPTEQQVKEAMTRATSGRTTLVIAHRLATVTDCDQILVMDAGHIVEAGTHAQLLEQNGRYARSWLMQSRKREAGENDDMDLVISENSSGSA